MSQSEATRPMPKRSERPLSPHLTVYRWPVTMTMSILHRITGGALYFAMLLIAWWLVAAATSERAFAVADAVMTSWFGLLVILGLVWALFHHLAGGVRHLVWDTGHGLAKADSSRFAWATLGASLLLTLLFALAYLLMGR